MNSKYSLLTLSIVFICSFAHAGIGVRGGEDCDEIAVQISRSIAIVDHCKSNKRYCCRPNGSWSVFACGNIHIFDLNSINCSH